MLTKQKETEHVPYVIVGDCTGSFLISLQQLTIGCRNRGTQVSPAGCLLLDDGCILSVVCFLLDFVAVVDDNE